MRQIAFDFTYSHPFLQRHSLQQQNSLKHHFGKQRMDILFIKCILDNSKFSLKSKCLGTSGVIVKQVHCNFRHLFLISVKVLKYVLYQSASRQETIKQVLLLLPNIFAFYCRNWQK